MGYQFGRDFFHNICFKMKHYFVQYNFLTFYQDFQVSAQSPFLFANRYQPTFMFFAYCPNIEANSSQPFKSLQPPFI